jgi:SulP family sulfate permease
MNWPLRLHRFRPRAVDAIRHATAATLWRDVGAGITVAIVALPLAMAFGIASGVTPEQGLITAIVGGFIVAALGGSNVQISGPAGAFIVVVYGIVSKYGLTNLLISTALAGVLLLLMGWFRLGVLVRYLPVGVVVGFTNGIAVLIAMSQLKELFGLNINPWPADFFAQWRTVFANLHHIQPAALGMGLACFTLVALWPKPYSTKPSEQHPALRRLALGLSRVPGTVIVLVLSTVACGLLELPLATIGSRFGGVPQALPVLSLPPFSWESAKELVGPTLTLALLGAVESLLCARVADDATELPRHDPNQELMAQGLANMVVPLFGGIPVTGTMARTMTNVRAGGSTPLAAMVHALTLLAVVVLAAPWAVHIPLAALAGILIYVAVNMGAWREFERLRRFSSHYRSIMLSTFLLTVVFDLTVAVQVGLLLACAFFILRMSELFRIEARVEAQAPAGTVVMHLFGALFFGAVAKLEQSALNLPPGTRTLVLEMHQLVSLDTTGLDALQHLHHELSRQGVALVLCSLNPQPLELIQRSGFASALGPSGLVQTLSEALSPASSAC